MRLADKVAVVTGGGSGIGRGIAQMFAREGARVLVADIIIQGGQETVASITEAGGEARFEEVDVSDSKDTQRMVSAALENWGKLDILVNNAAVLRLGSVTGSSEEDWDRTLDVNLRGVFLSSRAAIPAIILNGGGSVVNIASVGGLVGPRGLAAYAAAKAGVINLTRQMANEYGPENIRVNCICPGTVVTPMHNAFYTPETKEETLAEWARSRPLRTVGTPEDIAYAATFLASNTEARFITGSILVVDGGVIAAGAP